jgi:integrase/recombinase XerD
MLMSGLRISEIRTATIADDKTVLVLGKGNNERLVPTLPWIIEAMKRIKRQGEGGWAMGRKTIWKRLKTLEITQPHTRKTPHSLRHTYASELLHRGKPIEKIQVLLGHKQIQSTRIYAKTDVSSDEIDLLDSEPKEEEKP